MANPSGDSGSMSFRNRLARTVSRLKSSHVARMAVAPPKIAQLAIQDIGYKNSEDSRYLRSLESMYVGQRCYIVGNGPSLRPSDLDAISDEVSFGANKIDKMFALSDWRPTFYTVFDLEYIMQEAEKIERLPIEKMFIDWSAYAKRIQQHTANATIINVHPKFYSTHRYTTDNICFSKRPDKFIGSGHTVTFIALQLALWMGFSEIYLIGMDHNFTHVVNSDGVVITNEGVEDHCYEDNPNVHINPQYREGVEYAYRLARAEAESRGIHIYNATRGGSLEVFERVDLDEVLRERSEEK